MDFTARRVVLSEMVTYYTSDKILFRRIGMEKEQKQELGLEGIYICIPAFHLHRRS